MVQEQEKQNGVENWMNAKIINDAERIYLIQGIWLVGMAAR